MSAQPQAAAAPTVTLELEPARQGVKVTVAIPGPASSLDVWRTASPTGDKAFVRGAADRTVAGPMTVVVFDWEAPLGVPLTYHAQTDGSSAIGQAAAAFTLTDGRDWLVDLARPTNSFPVVVEAFPELAFDGPVGVHRVLDRRDPVLTTAPFWTPSGTLTFVTDTELERDHARGVLGAGIPFLFRTPPGEGVGNIYLGATGFREQRASRLAVHDDRRFVVEVVQVARPDPAVFVPVPPFTYADVKATWATYAALKATGKSYQDLAYTFPSDRVDPVPPWLPDDV